jgi:hypothetical protein
MWERFNLPCDPCVFAGFYAFQSLILHVSHMLAGVRPSDMGIVWPRNVVAWHLSHAHSAAAAAVVQVLVKPAAVH